MARDASEFDDDGSLRSGDGSADRERNDGLLHRRSYLKYVGTTAVAATAAAGTATAADYDVIELDPGERRVVHVDSGETFENVLFDQTAPGASATLIANGTNWTVRNVGWKGEFSHEGRAFACSDRGGNTSRIENVYIGDGVDGSVGGRRHPKLGIWVAPQHSGHLVFERVYVKGAHDNAFYASAPGSNGNGERGTVLFKDCYAQDSWVSGFRLSRGRVENCTAVNTSQGRNGRPLWVWPTDYHGDTVEVVDSNFVGGGYPNALDLGRDGRRTDVYLENTHYSGGTRELGTVNLTDGGDNGTNPDPSVPAGVPESAEAAASGDGSGDSTAERPADDDDDDLENVILFDGSEEAITRYEFVVDGAVEPSTDEGATIDEAAEVDGGTASGVVANWKDAFRFEGDLEELTVDGPATVLVNGEEVDPGDVGDELPHVLEIEGVDVPTSYEVTVDGEIEYDGETEAADDVTVVSGTTVESSLTDETQQFRFAGAITALTIIDGEATVLVDGEEVDPDEYGESARLPHALIIDGTEASGPSTYSFRIDGDVAKADYRGASIDEEDVIEGDAVRGTVANWRDAYWFDGDVTDFTLLGDARVDVEYNVHDR